LLEPPSAEYPAFSIKKLVAVEPSSGMRGAWERGLAKLPANALDGVDATTVDGGFDDFSKAAVASGTADAVIIAQAFHWCPDYEAAMTEIARYLAPGCPLVLVWNLEANTDEWHQSLRDLYQPLDLGSPQYYRGLWRKMFDTQAYKTLFDPVEEDHFPWDMPCTEDQLVERLFTKSYLTEAHLNGEKREQFERELRKTVREGNKEWIDEKVRNNPQWDT